jgi:hypothetical protein
MGIQLFCVAMLSYYNDPKCLERNYNLNSVIYKLSANQRLEVKFGDGEVKTCLFLLGNCC